MSGFSCDDQAQAREILPLLLMKRAGRSLLSGSESFVDVNSRIYLRYDGEHRCDARGNQVEVDSGEATDEVEDNFSATCRFWGQEGHNQNTL